MNLPSALAAALACGVIVLVGVELSGSLLAAVAAALLFAGSYTFWSQAVIAEVYALHILLVALTLLLAAALGPRADLPAGCAGFFAVYALGLRQPPVDDSAAAGLRDRSSLPPRRAGGDRCCRGASSWRLRRRVAFGALQYAWNFSALWRRAGATRQRWRSAADVLVRRHEDRLARHDGPRGPAVMASERLRMYAFDLRQQFGWVPPLVAAVGLVHLARHDLRRVALILADLCRHASSSRSATTSATRTSSSCRRIWPWRCWPLPACWPCSGPSGQRADGWLPIALVALAGWNAFVNYPALDRSDDRRPTAVLSSMTDGIAERSALLLTDLNWQVQNGLTYFGQDVRPEVRHAWLPEVMLYAPALIRDNRAVDRAIVATERAPDRSARRMGRSSASRSTVRPRLWSRSSAPCPRARATCCAC